MTTPILCECHGVVDCPARATATAAAEQVRAAAARPRALLFDVESTGTGEGAQIIEAAMANVESASAPLVPIQHATLVERYKPSIPIQFGAMAAHHIIPEDLEGCRPSSEFRFPIGINYLIGHNIDFDWDLAGRPDVRRICTLALARSLWPTLDSHTLGALIYALRPPARARELLEDAHSAVVDVDNLAIVLREICLELQPKSWRELWLMSEEARIPKVMAFGKHKGVAVVDLPRDYGDWILRQADMDEYVKIAVRRMRGLDA